MNDVAKIVGSFNSTLESFLDNQIKKTPWSKKIIEIKWSSSCKRRYLTFRKHTQVLTKKECEEEIVTKLLTKYRISIDAMRPTEVEVYTINIDWLLRDRNNFLKFNSELQGKSSRIFTTRYMQALVDEFWDENYYRILKYCYLPW